MVRNEDIGRRGRTNPKFFLNPHISSVQACGPSVAQVLWMWLGRTALLLINRHPRRTQMKSAQASPEREQREGGTGQTALPLLSGEDS